MPKRTLAELQAKIATLGVKGVIDAVKSAGNTAGFDVDDLDRVRKALATRGLKLYACSKGLCIGSLDDMLTDFAADAAADTTPDADQS